MTTAKPLISALKSAVVRVASIAQARRFFEGVLGLQAISETALLADKARRLWGLEAREVHCVRLARPTENFGMIDLVELPDTPEKPMRENPLDLGWFVLSFRTTQMEAALAACERIGARAVNAPRSYEAGAQPMREAMIELDAGLRCALVEVGGAKNDLPLFAEPVAAACAIVPALPKALAFYRDALGLSVAVTLDHPGEPFAGMIGAPSATRVQKALLTAGTWTGKLELLQLGLPAGYEQRDATIHTDGRRLGYWMMSVMTANLDLLQAACRYAGIPILRGPATIDRPCYGRVKAMIVRGPGGELLECLAPANRITRP